MPNLIPVDYDPFTDAAPAAPNSVPANSNPFAAAPAATFAPVDHDPFANGPGTPARLIPVDYDPFADRAPGTLRLVPVDYDPFADGPGTPVRLVPVDYDPFADVPAAAQIAGQSSPQPNPQPSSAGSSIRNFPLATSPNGFAAAPTLQPNSFSPYAQSNPSAAIYPPSNNLTAPVWPPPAPMFPDVARRFSFLENPPAPEPPDTTLSLLGLIPRMGPEYMSLLALASGGVTPRGAALGNATPSSRPPENWNGPQPAAFTGAAGVSSVGDLGGGTPDAGNSTRVQLAQAPTRRGINLEDIFDPLAPLRIDLYNAVRRDLQQLQPQNYRLSVPSARATGDAPTKEEIGELQHAYGVAQQTQPLADIASRIWRLLVDPRAQENRTVAVLKTSKGLYIATSGDKPFTAEQEAAIRQVGALALRPFGKNIHAEIAALSQAKGDPQFIAASRPFCPELGQER